MDLDVRLPIGWMFTIFGVLLCVYGALTRESSIYVQHSLGINVNWWWGLVLIIFGLMMLLFARRKFRG